MGNYMRILSGMNVDFHNHSRDVIPQTGPAPFEPKNLAARYEPVAKEYMEDTIKDNDGYIDAIALRLTELSKNMEGMARERFEQDLLLMKSCDLIGELLYAVTEGIPAKPETIDAARDYMGIFGH